MEERAERDGIIRKDMVEIEDGPTLVSLKKPIEFEGVEYRRIDLSGLANITAHDMMDVSRRMNRNGNADFYQELSLEYALNLASVATGMPLEFFDILPPYAAMRIKNCVTYFLYRQG